MNVGQPANRSILLIGLALFGAVGLSQTTTLPAPRVQFPSGGFAEVGGVIDGWYRRYLGRPSDPDGLAAWIEYVRRGKSLRDIQVQILASEEYFARASRRNDLFIRTLFRDELGRIPTNAEVDQWLRRMRSVGDKRSRLIVEFLDWSDSLAQSQPTVSSNPADLTRQIVDESWVLVDTARRETVGTPVARPLVLRANALLAAADDFNRLTQSRSFRPEQWASSLAEVNRAVVATEEMLAQASGTAPTSTSIVRRIRFITDRLGQTVAAKPPSNVITVDYDARGLDELIEELGNEVERMVRILRFPVRPTYVDQILQRELSGFAGQVADFRGLVWDRRPKRELRAALVELQRRSAHIAPNLAATSQPAAATDQWRNVEEKIQKLAISLDVNTWPAAGDQLLYTPGTEPGKISPTASTITIIDAMISDVDVFLDSLTPLMTTYPDAFWLQAECRRLRANLLTLRDLARRGADPRQLRDQLRRAVDGYQRIQERYSGARRQALRLEAPNLRDRLIELERLIGS